MTEKRFTVAVYDENAINGFTVLDLEKPNSSKRLKYENVYIGSKVGCEIVCNFGNSLAEENEQLKLLLREVEHELTTLTGLTATDSTSIVKEDMEEYGLFRLDYTELLKKIYKELQE